MPFLTIRDILNKVEKFHGEFGTRLHEAESAAENGEAKMLLRFLGNHQKQLAGILASMDADKDQEIATLDEWVQFDTEVRDPRGYLSTFTLSNNATAAEVLETANKLDVCLFCLYKGLAKGGSTPKAQRLFGRLARMELDHQKAKGGHGGYY
ncbi:MAG: hypothetical protein DHS20C21_21640 [Gemmatimonadota bacterium]|nr:MAG: hypothetical protein DHS20C21_21640 [Gemmatimonadota bacterium]